MNNQEEDWLVSPAYCSGCKYYATLSRSNKDGIKCCDYTCETGRLRHNPPKTCDVKEIGKRKRRKVGITISKRERKEVNQLG